MRLERSPRSKLLLGWTESLMTSNQAIGGAQDAARMQRVVSFYEKLPRGPAPEVQAKGLLGRYQARYFGKNPSVARKFCPFKGPYNIVGTSLWLIRSPALIHVIGFLLLLGYGNNYYFHLRA